MSLYVAPLSHDSTSTGDKHDASDGRAEGPSAETAPQWFELVHPMTLPLAGCEWCHAHEGASHLSLRVRNMAKVTFTDISLRWLCERRVWKV